MNESQPPSKLSAVEQRKVVHLANDDPFNVANCALAPMRPEILSREPEACRQFLKFAVKVTNLAEEMRREFIMGGDQAGLDALAANAPHWPARAFPGPAAKREREEVDGLPIGLAIVEDLPPRKSKAGRPPDVAAAMANEIFDRLVEIRNGDADGPVSTPALAVAIRQILPVLDSTCFHDWFSCGWTLLQALATEPDEEQLAEYRLRLRNLVRHTGGDIAIPESDEIGRAKIRLARIERATRSENADAPLYPVGSTEPKYPPNRFAKFLSNDDRAKDLKEKGLKKSETGNIGQDVQESTSRPRSRQHNCVASHGRSGGGSRGVRGIESDDSAEERL